MKFLLVVTAVFECATGLVLLAAPEWFFRLLLGVDLPMAPIGGRVAGVALLAMGIGCWLARHRGRKATCGMLAYNILAATGLAGAGLVGSMAGVLLWPAVVIHAALGCWCAACLWNQPA